MEADTLTAHCLITFLLGAAEQLLEDLRGLVVLGPRQLLAELVDVHQLVQEPVVNLSQVVDLLGCVPVVQGPGHGEQTLVGRHGQQVFQAKREKERGSENKGRLTKKITRSEDEGCAKLKTSKNRPIRNKTTTAERTYQRAACGAWIGSH